MAKLLHNIGTCKLDSCICGHVALKRLRLIVCDAPIYIHIYINDNNLQLLYSDHFEVICWIVALVYVYIRNCQQHAIRLPEEVKLFIALTYHTKWCD